MRIWAFLFTICFSGVVLAQSFLPNTGDIPLMDGIEQVEELASFDQPNERMVILGAKTTKTKQDIFAFYHQSLINLGWQAVSAGHYTRGTDSFTIEVTAVGTENRIQFVLSQSNE